MSDEIVKRYYSIGEVAEMFAVNASLLRHWETEFDTIRPKKNRKGERQYTQKDVETIRPEPLVLAAMLPRADVRDRLIGAESIEALPHWARVGTSSPRRAAQPAA